MLLSPNLDSALTTKSAAEQTPDISAILAEKAQLIASLSKGFIPKALKLMVAMSALLSPQDYRRLGTILWDQHLGGSDPTLTASVRYFLYKPFPTLIFPLGLLSDHAMCRENTS
jgi:hypothetical protein